MKILSRSAIFLVTLFSVLCCFLPLFNYLGYEFSTLTAIVLSFVCGLSLIAFADARGIANGSSNLLMAREAILLTAIPLVIVSVNAFFVKNCSLTEGLVFYALQVIPAVLFSCSLAFVTIAVFKRKRKTILVVLLVLTLSHILFATLAGPQIFAFNPVVGFFAGLTYDESLHILPRLALYRLGTIALATAIVGGALALRGSPRSSVRRVWLAVAVLAAVVWAGMFVSSDRLGHSSSETWIGQKLGGFRETDHFLITYSLQALNDARIDRVASLAEFQFEKLRRTLRVQPGRKVRLYLYASEAQKGEFVGAAGTNISKPWLWQIHINAGDVESTLKHELVHVMAAEFGFPLLRVAPNSGLIEGLAVAVERVSAGRPVHTTAAEIYAIGLNPDVASLFSISGFLSVHPAVSYSLAGSFCRFLIDSYGFRRFKDLYRDNDFQGHYGKPKEELMHEWRRFLENFRTSESEAVRARYLFRRPTIFGKECARVIANLNERTRELIARREFGPALQNAELSLSHSRNGEAIQQKMFTLLKLRRFPEASSFAEQQFADTTTALALPTLRLSWGDALWAQDSAAADSSRRALALYGQVERLHISAAWDEVCLLRKAAASNPGTLGALKRMYVDDFSDSARTRWLQDLFVHHTAMPLAAYLYGRDLYGTEHWQGAIDVLRPLSPLREPLLEYLRLQRIARACFQLGTFERAKFYFWESQNYTDDEARLLEIREWIERCDFTKLARP